MTFIEQHGLVQYSARRLFPRTGVCEWCQISPLPRRATEFDHCHKHGWIRGEICSSHNMRLSSIDAGRNYLSWQHWMIEHWYRCPDCAATDERRMPVLVHTGKRVLLCSPTFSSIMGTELRASEAR